MKSFLGTLMETLLSGMNDTVTGQSCKSKHTQVSTSRLRYTRTVGSEAISTTAETLVGTYVGKSKRDTRGS